MLASPPGAGIAASSLSFKAAALMALGGMVWGIVMAISHDHAAMPAHAHLNLLGWVSLFLFGVFYRLHPQRDRSRLARVQVVLWIVGTLVMVFGVARIQTGHEEGERFAAVGAILALVAMQMFVFQVLRSRPAEAASVGRPAAVPAE